jgi:hypothetical protein
MKTLSFLSACIVLLFIASCGKYEESTGKVIVTFNSPNATYPKDYPAGSTCSFTLKDTSFTYLVNDDSSSDYTSGKASFGEVKTLELNPGHYSLSAPVRYESLCPGFPPTTSNLDWNNTQQIHVEKGKTITVSIH